MNNTVEKMVERINNEIKQCREYYGRNGWDKLHEKNLSKIDGMVAMLEIVTEKHYTYGENGLVER